jgi:hypothetical protein
MKARILTVKRNCSMRQGVAKGATQNLAEVQAREVAVLIVVAFPDHRSVLKLKHLISRGSCSADHATAAGKWRIAKLHCADGLVSIVLTNGVELRWRRRIQG